MSNHNATTESRRSFVILQIVTLARIPLAIVVAVLLLHFGIGRRLVAVAACVMVVGEITDALDGFLARRWNLTSELGALLDPYSDSISRIIIYWSLACAGLCLAVVPLVLALRDVTVSTCRVVWMKKGKPIGARTSGKIKAIVQAVAAIALVLGPFYAAEVQFDVATTLSWIVIAVTIYSAIDYMRVAFQPSSN